MDCIIVFVSGLLVFYLQHGGLGLAQHFWQVALGLAVCLVVYIISFFAFHTYHGVMRYSSFVDLHRVAYSTATAGVGYAYCIRCKCMQVSLSTCSFLVLIVPSCSLLLPQC